MATILKIDKKYNANDKSKTEIGNVSKTTLTQEKLKKSGDFIILDIMYQNDGAIRY